MPAGTIEKHKPEGSITGKWSYPDHKMCEATEDPITGQLDAQASTLHITSRDKFPNAGCRRSVAFAAWRRCHWYDDRLISKRVVLVGVGAVRAVSAVLRLVMLRATVTIIHSSPSRCA